MHTFTSETVLPKTVFHYNPDLTGDVIIKTKTSEIAVPGVALLDFIAEYVRNEKMAQLENADREKLLGIRPL